MMQQLPYGNAAVKPPDLGNILGGMAIAINKVSIPEFRHFDCIISREKIIYFETSASDSICGVGIL